MPSVTIVGVGRVGGAFAIALSGAGYKVETLVARDRDRLKEIRNLLPAEASIIAHDKVQRVSSDILLITTQDSEIGLVSKSLARIEIPTTPGFAFHASGALSSNELEPLSRCGWKTGSLHPLISISNPVAGSESLSSAYFAVEGSPEAVSEGKKLVARLGASSFELPTASKTLYHAAAVTACGHLAALAEVSQQMLRDCGLTDEDARKVLFPLMLSTVSNLGNAAPSEVLTGPFARGDVDTIRRHLQDLSKIADRDSEEVYRLLGRISIDLAARHGADEQRLNEMRKIILLDK